MRFLRSAFLGILVFCPVGQAQTPTDSKTLQAILEEVRQLRMDLHSTAATVERAQIILYRMRIQADIVARLSQRVEESQERLRQVKNAQAQNAARIKTIEDTIDQTQDGNDRKHLEDELSSRKGQIERFSTQQQELETRESEQSSQLRLEQSKLDDLQANLDQLQKNLENAARPAGSPH
ncbi:MAG TPA: hypothetical protein VKD70_16365 [Candidatus Acidoferrum sp.]|nr:hypothetical protein [Candidatus Acidoferrum sp.]